MSSGASLSLPDGLFAPHELVRELGARGNPMYVLRQAGVGIGGKPVLAVAERYVGAVEVGPGAEDLARDARRIATLASPNLARVRDVLVRGRDLVVIGEFVEGEKLQEVWRPDKLPLEIALRVIVDALAGAGALHNLRDAKQQPMKLAHGEIAPATIVLGLDGIGRVLHAVARRVPGVQPEPASVGYLSPEVASGDPYDARADVFSAGVLLWEALSEKRLFPEPDPEGNARRVRAGALPRAVVSEKAAWAKGLVDVAAKALAAAPDERWPTAAVMASELRKAAGLKLAPASTAAAFARSAFGERVKVRRESLDAASAPSRPPKPEPVPAASPAPPKAAPKPEPVAAASPPAPKAAPKPEPVAAASPPAPKAAPKPKEPSFLEVDAESDIDTVLVVPGLRAPVSEVVELESDLLLESTSNSSFPPAATSPAPPAVSPPTPTRAISPPTPTRAISPPTPGTGFVRDPFGAAPPPARPPPQPTPMAFTPPPAPAVAVAPVVMLQDRAVVEEPPPPSITGSPHFAAAIDLQPPPAFVATPDPYPPPPVAAVPSFAMPAQEPPEPDEVAVAGGGARRRKVVVLGGVGVLGLVVFVLAALRLARHEPEVMPAATHPPATTAAAVVPPPPAVSAAAPPASTPAPAPPPVTATAAATPAVAVTTAPVAVATPPVTPTATFHAPPPAAKPIPVVTAAPTHAPPAAQATAAAKPRPKPTFDPNSL